MRWQYLGISIFISRPTGNIPLTASAGNVSVKVHTALEMKWTLIPVFGEQELRAYNGCFESTCFHSLLEIECQRQNGN